MAEKKEVVIKLTAEQRQQILSATGQDLTELKVGMIEGGNPLAVNPLDERANPLSLDDRANPLQLGDRANPLSVMEDRANPIQLGDRANPLSVIDE